MFLRSHKILCTISKTATSSSATAIPKSKLIAMNNFQNSHSQFYSSNETKGNAVKVEHDTKAEKFFVSFGKDEAFLEYEKQNGIISLLHTEVPEALEGRGLGKILVKEAFQHIAQNNLKAEVHCDFVWHYLEKYDPGFKKNIINSK